MSSTEISTEAPPNWLSKEIELIRQRIDRIIPVFELKAEAKAIMAVIRARPEVNALAQLRKTSDKKLSDIVKVALGIANHVEREKRNNPDLMTASPAIQASWYIFDELGIERPQPDVSAAPAKPKAK